MQDPAIARLSALSSEIDGVFSRFQMTERESADLLREVLLLTIYRWDRVESHELWLLATLRRGCLHRLRERAKPAGGSAASRPTLTPPPS